MSVNDTAVNCPSALARLANPALERYA